MHVKILLISMTAFLCIPFSRLHADIIITRDDMILNGKIMEKKWKQIIFGNYHGVFTIDKSQIKEMHETRDYKEDLSIFRNKGRRVDESEVKKNYQAGLARVKDRGNEKVDGKSVPRRYTLYITPFYIINGGRLGEVMPHSTGVALMGDIPLKEGIPLKGFPDIRKAGISGLRAEAGYFSSKNNTKSVQGARISSGPLWEFPFTIAGINGIYTISPVLGIGYYTIENGYRRAAAVKWHASCITGPTFVFHNTVVFPQLRFDFIYDGKAPLYGIGLGIGLGYRFPL